MTPTTQQPDALRLADWLEHRTNIMLQDRQAAAELRRLHAEVEKLRHAQGGEAVAWESEAGTITKDRILAKAWENHGGKVKALRYASPPLQADACRYPDCKCPTENPCLKGLPQADACKVPQGMASDMLATVEALQKETDAGWSPDARKLLNRLTASVRMISAAPTQVETQADKT
jgi:hypothetical protein